MPPSAIITGRSHLAHKSHVTKALQHLSALAGQKGVMIELALCHGAVIAVASALNCTRGPAVRPNDIVVRLAETVYLEHRLRHDWLETDVAILLAAGVAGQNLQPAEFAPGVLLSVNETARILALKLSLLSGPLPPDATDARDAEFLLEKISVTSLDQIQRIYARVLPGDPLSDTAHRLITRVLNARVAKRK